jgi:DamX protein
MYSLQLLGSRSRQAVIDYVRQNRLRSEQTAYYRGSYKGGEWYVLVYGIFPNRQSALDAQAGLPVRVRREKPWPRSLASVHTAIREAQ